MKELTLKIIFDDNECYKGHSVDTTELIINKIKSLLLHDLQSINIIKTNLKVDVTQNTQPTTNNTQYIVERDWRIGKYFITKRNSNIFEVVQYKSCGNGSDALVGTSENFDDAMTILRKRNEDWKFVEQREICGIIYYHYEP